MASVQLRISALPEHVRTARLVATAVARRLGFPDEALEEIRLAVGEACARAVQRSEGLDASAQVEVNLCDDDRRLVIEVLDRADAADEVGSDLALMLLEGLADSVTLGAGPGGAGGSLRLEWGPRA